MQRKRILDVMAIALFVIGVFGLGWSLTDRSLVFKEISRNFEAAIFKSQISTGLIQSFSAKIFDEKTARMVFVGDVMLSRGVAYQIKKNNDFYYPFLKIADYLNSFDLAVGNLEGPISDKGKNQGSIYSFRADPKVVGGLVYAGFDLISLANNHMLDWGREALVQTREFLEAEGIKAIGAGRNYEEANAPVLFEVGGQKLAFLSYTDLYPKSLAAIEVVAGVSDFSVESVAFGIENLKREGNLVVVLMHWGEEYQTKSNTTQQKIARGFIDAGADLVVGTHPHVPQEIEEYNPPAHEATARRGWIVYSLGNFVFDQNFSAETMRGMVVEVEVLDGEVVGLEPRDVMINASFQPFLTSE